MESTATATTPRRYHLGLRAKNAESGLPCPVDYITLAGVTFHKHTEKVTGWGPQTKRQRVQGGYAMLTDQQIADVKKALDKTRVQFLARDPQTGQPKVYTDDTQEPPRQYVRARIVTVGVRGYIPKDTDVRLDGWLYLVPQEAPTVYEVQDPPSVDWSSIGKTEAKKSSGSRSK